MRIFPVIFDYRFPLDLVLKFEPESDFKKEISEKY